MNRTAALCICLVLSLGFARADEPKADAKKSDKPKPAAKSEKNVFQKAESSLTDWARKNKVWTTGEKKSEKKAD
jgi:hypothetical protein